MKNVFLKITENKPLTDSVWQMTLAGDCAAINKPGQFINIKLDGFYLTHEQLMNGGELVFEMTNK